MAKASAIQKSTGPVRQDQTATEKADVFHEGSREKRSKHKTGLWENLTPFADAGQSLDNISIFSQPSGIVQTKGLKVGAPGDKYELQADQVAGRVMRSVDSDHSVSRVMGETFGSDFSDVRLHTDSKADKISSAFNARALTTGRDVFFKRGEYHPESSDGQKLLAHEFTHVLQQERMGGDMVQASFLDKKIDKGGTVWNLYKSVIIDYVIDETRSNQKFFGDAQLAVPAMKESPQYGKYFKENIKDNVSKLGKIFTSENIELEYERLHYTLKINGENIKIPGDGSCLYHALAMAINIIKGSEGKKEVVSEGEKEVVSEGEKEGESEGKKEGESEGKKEGESEGEKEGESEGKKEGESEGEKEVVSEGEKEGVSEGKKEVVSEGEKEGVSEGKKEGDTTQLRQIVASYIDKNKTETSTEWIIRSFLEDSIGKGKKAYGSGMSGTKLSKLLDSIRENVGMNKLEKEEEAIKLEINEASNLELAIKKSENIAIFIQNWEASKKALKEGFIKELKNPESQFYAISEQEGDLKNKFEDLKNKMDLQGLLDSRGKEKSKKESEEKVEPPDVENEDPRMSKLLKMVGEDQSKQAEAKKRKTEASLCADLIEACTENDDETSKKIMHDIKAVIEEIVSDLKYFEMESKQQQGEGGKPAPKKINWVKSFFKFGINSSGDLAKAIKEAVEGPKKEKGKRALTFV